jgi:glycosyltransferase involved in cell wall biosynthesis
LQLSSQAVEEAKELCLPTVTMGYGSLAEQIDHEKSGLIANNFDEFSYYVFELFNNEILYNKINDYLKLNRGKKMWNRIAKKFLSDLNNIKF